MNDDIEIKGVPLDELPALFALQLTCAMVGMFLTGAWFLYFFWTLHWTFGANMRMIGWLAFALLLFGLTFIFILRGQKVALIDRERGRARAWLFSCSTACVFGMSILIWASGGPASPFVSLYIMTHTLTLASVKMRRGPYFVAFFFSVPLIVALWVDKVSPIGTAPPTAISELVEGSSAFQLITIGAILSIIVSTIGHLWNNRRLQIQEAWQLIEKSNGYKGSDAVTSRIRAKGAIGWLDKRITDSNQTIVIAVRGGDGQFSATLGVDKQGTPAAMIEFASWKTVYGLAPKWWLPRSGRLLTFARLYVDGKIAVSGDLLAVARFADILDSKPPSRLSKVISKTTRSMMVRLGLGGNSLSHYGASADFYELFLDEHMQYTCGFWDSDLPLKWPTDIAEVQTEINDAQVKKMQLIADWLDLKPGASILDVGCGWGGLAGFLAKERGVSAYGVTNSREQAEYAKNRWRDIKVAQQEFSDFEPTECFDAITVVGMLEHVPAAERDEFFTKLYSLLKPNGRLYLQCINKSAKWSGGDGSRFLDRFVFPGYTLENLETVKARAERLGLTVLKEQSSYRHYSRTSLLWLYLIANKKDQVERLAGDRMYRIMTAYLSVAALVFSDGRGALDRLLLEKPLTTSDHEFDNIFKAKVLAES